MLFLHNPRPGCKSNARAEQPRRGIIYAMDLNDLVLISVDDHVVEPPDLFEEHLAPAFRGRDDIPRVVKTEVGDDVWEYDGRHFPNIGLNAVVGRPRHDFGMEPTSFEEMRRGCWDVDARVDDMNANGVLASLCFPSFPRLCGQVFAEAQDKKLAVVLVRAYNDWHIHSWCGKYPGRFMPLGILPFWDVDLTVAELTRLKDLGVNAVSFSENPSKLGYPSFHTDHWDPLWSTCQDLEIVPCLHIGSSSSLVVTAPEAPFDVQATLQPMNIVQAAVDLAWSPVLRNFPRLKIALSEGGVGWLPYVLDKLDLVYQKQAPWTGQDYGDELPSEVLRDRLITCFIDDRVTRDVAERAGVDNMTWECDYPHSDCDWPRSPEVALAGLSELDDETIDRLTHLNAMRLFQFDPFAHRPKERSNVGALRAEAEEKGVDTELRTMRTRTKVAAGSANDMQALVAPGGS
jgi:predicted TIM-barrel fold metal-dependent hydrolase